MQSKGFDALSMTVPEMLSRASTISRMNADKEIRVMSGVKIILSSIFDKKSDKALSDAIDHLDKIVSAFKEDR